jgi:Bifunctional DNA primase/polymerase, N-terminal
VAAARNEDDVTANLDAALRYAGYGWPVFPCKPGSKEPATIHGFHDATTDLALITAWWSRVPAANVAIATGAPGPDVLDVDVKPDGTGYPALNRLKRAGLLSGGVALVSTRNGGLHVYFPGTLQPCGRLPRLHLDLKAAGGYVLAPPSTVPTDDWAPNGTGRYELLDHRGADGRLDWAACRRLLDPPRPAPPRDRRTSGGIGSLAGWLSRQQQGNRNHGLYWAACRAVEAGLDAALDELVAAALAAGLDERETRRTVASAQRRGGGAA